MQEFYTPILLFLSNYGTFFTQSFLYFSTKLTASMFSITSHIPSEATIIKLADFGSILYALDIGVAITPSSSPIVSPIDREKLNPGVFSVYLHIL